MKKEFSTCPEAIDESRLFGFSWMEFVAGIPSPLVLVTGYKANGKSNASMQSWTSHQFSRQRQFPQMHGYDQKQCILQKYAVYDELKNKRK